MKRIGTQEPLDEAERSRLVTELNFWRDRAEEYFERRDRLERSFYCIWEGQHPSGLVLDTDEERAWPFHGASDQRVRLADAAFQKLEALLCSALSAATIEVTATGADAEKRSASILTLLKWMLDGLGSEGWGQIRAMMHYFLVDSPAVAALAVDWRRTCSLRPAETDAETVVGEFAAAMSATGEMSEIDATNAAWAAIQPPDGERADTAALEAFLVASKGVRQADARKVVRALGEGDGRVEYLARGEADEGIRLTALRYGDNFCIPVECRSFDYASPWFRSEWLTKEQLLERVETDGWDAAWVEETLQHPGADFYNSRAVDAQSCEDYKDLFNICWCYTAETNDAGETVRRVCVLSHADGSAFGRRALSTRRGKWNAVLFRREVVSTRLLAGRGLAEICSADQGIVKTLSDRSNDNAIIGSLPPTVTKGTQARNAVIQPFGRIPVGTADDVRFMTPPQFPATAKDRAKEIRDALLDYLGVSNGETDVSGRTKAFVADFLRQVRDLFVLMVETAQDCASDELLAGVTDDGDVRGLKREDVTGRFGLKLTLDPDNLDDEKLMKKLTTFSQIIGMDKRGEIDTAPVMRHALFALFPEVSKRSLKSSEQLTADDLSDEQSNFVKIKAGVMPQMNTDGGWNYAARLGWWEQLQQENPDAIGEMSPTSREMMARWIEALRQQDTQYGENAEIGRTGVQGVGAMPEQGEGERNV